MPSHGAGSLANHVTIDEIVFGHGSAKGRETNTQKAVGLLKKMETADLVSGYVQRLMFVSLLRQLIGKKKVQGDFFFKNRNQNVGPLYLLLAEFQEKYVKIICKY